MSLEAKIKALAGVGTVLHQFVTKINENSPSYYEFQNIIKKAELRNPWFSNENTIKAIEYWSYTLNYKTISDWVKEYNIPENKNKVIGLVLAGNIPLVGLHDCICSLLCGYKVKIKLSSKDNVLIPYILNLWKEFCECIDFEFVEKLTQYDGVITTGSNNTAQYFEYYFRNIPSIIRKNRTSIAIFSGNENKDELENFSNDVFTYFGLGCRNVTQIFIPEDYNLDHIFKSFLKHHEVINHNKYSNNYNYNKAIFLMNNDIFWDNNFILLKESDLLYSPIGVLYFKRYKDIKDVTPFILENKEKIQCILSNMIIEDFQTISLGESQNPKISDYADGINTLDFLTSL